MITYVKTRKEFQELLRNEFIPYMNNNGMSQFLIDFQKAGMFHKWTMFFYEDKCVEIKEND
jgi:hypothetical protein